MTADSQSPRFEPPPWEKEAFDRFRQKQEEDQAAADLDAAMRAIREAPMRAPEGENNPAIPLDSTIAAPAMPAAAAAVPAAKTSRPEVPEAQVNAMLIQLRQEEPPAAQISTTTIDVIAAIMAVTGVYTLVRAVMLFARAGAAEPAAKMLAATLSFVVVLCGIGFIGGAVALYRKHHR